jgi:RsiW-degrading membrane proteinase PrsW (M82 family)
MTLGTFFITAATGVITLRWDTPEPAIAVIAGVIFAIGVLLFMIFSHFTFREMNAQFDIVDSYRGKLESSHTPVKRLELWKWGTGLPIAILFVVAFLSFDGWWLFRSKPLSGQASQITVPMKVRVGQQPEVTIDVPIKVTVP